MLIEIKVHPQRQPLPEPVCELLRNTFIGEGYASATQVGNAFDGFTLATRGTAYVAVDADVDCTVGTLFLVGPGDPFRQIAGPDELELHLMAVECSYRGRGVADALMRTCLTDARALGALRVVLSTQPSMAAAHKLYERHGFVRNPLRDWSRPDGRVYLAYEHSLTRAD